MIITNSKKGLQEAASAIERGGVVAVLSDTIYSMSCDATNDSAVRKIYSIKQRDHKEALPVLCGSIDQMADYVKVGVNARKILNHFTRGITMVLPLKEGANLSKYVNNEGNTLAVRIPGRSDALDLLNTLKTPLVSTSINVSGEKHINSSYGASIIFRNHLDIIVHNDDVNSKSSNVPSTIVDMTDDTQPSLLREGAINFHDVQSIL